MTQPTPPPGTPPGHGRPNPPGTPPGPDRPNGNGQPNGYGTREGYGPPPPGYGLPPGYGPQAPLPPRQPPVWPWVVGVSALLVVLLCLVAGGLLLLYRDGTPSAAAPSPRTESGAPMPRLTPEPGEVTPLPDPPRVIGRDVTVSGRGTKTVAVALEPDAAYVATITHDGTSNFMVEALDDDRRSIGLIVNAIGDYAGDRTVGLAERGTTAAFRVRATGTWKIVLRDLSKAPAFTGEAAGRKPAVFRVPDGAALGRQITATHSGRDNFVVRGFGDDDRFGLFINEIGRFHGTEPLPPDTHVIEVDAQGGWTLQAA